MHATSRCHASAQGEPKVELRAGDETESSNVCSICIMYVPYIYIYMQGEPKLELRAGDLV